jgi:hypothetical protein
MRSNSTLKLARLGAAALTATALALTFGARPASASLWQLSDSFEGDPSATWAIDGVGGGGGVFEIGVGTAKTGSNNAFLRADTDWYGVGRTVHVTPKEVHADANCSAGFQITPVGAAVTLLNIEVIDPDTWDYLALQTVRISSNGWRLVTSPGWTGGPVNVFVRVSMLAGRGFAPIRVDDLTVQCTFQ